MTTTLIPIDPAVSPQRSNRILTISADLLPDEIVAVRLARRTRGWVIVAVIVVACLCAAWFGYAVYQKQADDRKLTAAAAAVAELQRDQRQFSETVRVQSDTTLLTQQLTTVMANDLDWAALPTTLRTAGKTARIKITSINGTLNAAATAGTGASAATTTSNPLPGNEKASPIGSLMMTGTAPDKKAVAAYADALAEQSVVTNPYITTVTTDEDGKGVSFSLKADLPQTSLCGRFTGKCKSSGGK